MATYGTVKYGSKSNDVRTLQELLNQSGYGLTVDGVFGANTQQAVRDYQTSKGLSVDGIVGANTWGALTGGGASATTTTNPYGQYYDPATGQMISGTPADLVTGGSSGGGGYSPTSAGYAAYADSYAGARPTYSPSADYQSAADLLAQYEANRPGEYQSSYQDQIEALLSQIQNRDPFEYDFNADPLYQQYKGNYMQLGQQAMLDTMGNASALTGGYGNSYASTAGNQAYQQYVQQVNNVIPQLRDAAYQMYQDQGANMYNEMGLLQGLDATDYNRYRDDYGNWLNDLNYYYGKTGDLYNRDYGQYMDQYNMWAADRDFGYQSAYDAQQQANWDKEYSLAASKASGSGSSGGSSSGSGSSSSGTQASGAAMIGNMSEDDLDEIAMNIYRNAGMRDPYAAADATKYTSEQKTYIKKMIKELAVSIGGESR